MRYHRGTIFVIRCFELVENLIRSFDFAQDDINVKEEEVHECTAKTTG